MAGLLNTSITVVQDPFLMVWTLTAFAVLLFCGSVTVAKGHWAWFFVGLLTGGLLWLFSAFLTAAPKSRWERKHGVSRRAKLPV